MPKAKSNVPSKKATVIINSRPVRKVSVDALTAFLESLFTPLSPDAEPDLAKLAEAVGSRSARLAQDGALCRKFYAKLFKDMEYAEAVRVADFGVLADKIRKGR